MFQPASYLILKLFPKIFSVLQFVYIYCQDNELLNSLPRVKYSELQSKAQKQLRRPNELSIVVKSRVKVIDS